MNEDKSPFTVRAASPGDYGFLISVFNEIFGKDKDARTLEWKYQKNPHGQAVSWVAQDRENRIIGALTFMPRKVVVDGVEHLTLLAVDGMVFPEWQRKGIFVKLLNIMFAASWKMGAPFAIAFSGRRSVKGLIRTEWEEVGPVQELYLPLRGEHLLKGVIRRLPFSKGLACLAGDLILKRGKLKPLLTHQSSSAVKQIERFDAPLAETGDKTPVRLLKDAEWLNWRFIDTPTGRHQCFGAYRDEKAMGYLVLETRGGRSYIADLVGGDESVRKDLLAHAVRTCQSQGATLLSTMALEDDLMDKFYLSSGFRCRPKAGLLPFMIKMNPNNNALKSIILQSSLWTLSHGDQDAEHMTS